SPAELLEDLKKIQSGTGAALARQHAARVQLHAKAHNTRLMTAPRRRRSIWPLFAAGVVVVAGGGVAAGVLGRPKPAVATPAPKEHVMAERIPAIAEGPKDDPKKESEAATLYSSAENLMKEGKWTEALSDLQKLQKEYPSLQYTTKRSASIGERIGTCNSELRKAEFARTKQIDEARQLRRHGRR